MSQTMKALIKKEATKGIWMGEVPIPEPGPNDVQIKIIKTAICGTDIHIYNWDEWAQKTIPVPMVVGHEFVGKVSKLGNNVQGFKVGDIVSGEGHVVCGHCRNCMAGRRHLCAHTQGVGVNRDGAFAEYLTIPYANVWFCDKRIPTDILSIFDPFGNAAHTALSFDVLGEDVLITGCGPIGLMAIAIVKLAGARNIVAVDVNPYRLEKAKSMGATCAVNPTNQALKDVMKDLGMSEGFDVGLEMSGSAAALENMVSHMTHGGKIALLGILPAKTDVSWEKIVFNGLTLKGIYGREMYETWYKMQSMIQTGLDISKVITHRFPIQLYQQAFEIMASGKSGKVILNWEDD